jgi:hypothetical protein
MNAESGSRALNAANDLVELLRLTQGAAERVEQEVHGQSYEQADQIARDIHRVRRLAERLQVEIERFVSREASATLTGRHPLRRATDRTAQARPSADRPS